MHGWEWSRSHGKWAGARLDENAAASGLTVDPALFAQAEAIVAAGWRRAKRSPGGHRPRRPGDGRGVRLERGPVVRDVLVPRRRSLVRGERAGRTVRRGGAAAPHRGQDTRPDLLVRRLPDAAALVG